MKIFLVRHGEAIKLDNDSVLTPKGIEQAKNVAKELLKVKLDFAYVGDLTRAKQTLEEYKKINNSIETEVNSDLNEIYRVIVGGPKKDGTPEDREEKDKKRADNFFSQLLNSKKENIVIFAHGNIIRYFLSKALSIDSKGLWEKMVISPGSISIIEIDEQRKMQVKAINLYQHQKQFLDDFFNGKIVSESYL